MLIDFSTSLDSEFTADICIIGSGAAGFASSLSFINSGLNVIVLEGGNEFFNQEAADLHKAELVGKFHGGIHEGRERIIGGTTTKWGGQVFPFMKEDFCVRPHVPLSGWPLTFEDLKNFYDKAEKILGTDSSVPFSYKPWKDWKIKEPTLNTEKLDFIFTKWCKIPNLFIQHGTKIKKSKNIILLKNANVTELLPNAEHTKVNAVSISTLNNKVGVVNAKYFISAGGAFETVRLFLNSKKFSSSGIGNQNGLVGLYIQDHVACVVGKIFPESRTKFHAIFDPFYKNGFKYFPRLRMSPKWANEKKLLFASSQIVFDVQAKNTLTIAKEVFAKLRNKKLPIKTIIYLIFNPYNSINLLNILFRWKLKNRGFSPKEGPIWLEIHSEQNPSTENSITLSNEKDSLGMPRIKLNWNISELTSNTIVEMAKLTASEIEQSGIAKVELENWVLNHNTNNHEWMTDSYHQAGGLRMSLDHKTGVVDSDCKVYGIDNLYVASSAVFPTSSFSNPTMTIIALAIRIAECIISSSGIVKNPKMDKI
ncbi:GMC family oxidoreductase [Aurantibacter sp.]|uniref:GMC family oxidoreductase n=1 Tax=Aurantibacter sp. TaxID=2807103 RepID=UPI003263658B